MKIKRICPIAIRDAIEDISNSHTEYIKKTSGLTVAFWLVDAGSIK